MSEARSHRGQKDRNAPPPEKRQRMSRSKGLRTRSGCTHCRTRRVKCSEDRPVCAACRRRGEVCVYQHDSVSSAQSNHSTSTSRPGALQDKAVGEAQDQNANRPGDTGGADGSQQSAFSHEDDASSTPVVVNSTADRQTQRHSETTESSLLANGNTYSAHAEQAQGFLLDVAPSPDLSTLWAATPESSWSNPPLYSTETASLLWLGLLSNNAESSNTDQANQIPDLHNPTCAPSAEYAAAIIQGWVQGDATGLEDTAGRGGTDLEEDIVLEPDEVTLFRHFVNVLSTWIDITDSEHYFAVQVPSMALRDLGLMRAILALSARHLSMCPLFAHLSQHFPSAETLGVRYYHQALQHLQRAMKQLPYLRSDQLLATVLIISTYEMLDTNGRDWERHLKGVFWIQRSQLIHGESAGLKQAIWWAWLRQDIWAAFKDQRKILSFYTVKKPCSELGFWELVNRSVFLLGQCVNYASDKEVQGGATDVHTRINRGQELLSSLEQWKTCFAQHDRRLPTVPDEEFPFRPIWINPPAASLAVQVHHFARLLLSDLMPALSGLAELSKRRTDAQNCAAVMCGIAYCTTQSAAMITSIQCLYAARPHLATQREVDAVNCLLVNHQKQTGWPNHDVHEEVRTGKVLAVDNGELFSP